MEDENSPGLDINEGDKLVGDWAVVKRLGRGAYGEVFHVFHTTLEIEGATKIELLDAEEHILKIELEVLERYQDTNSRLMELYDYGVTEVFSYITMTLCGPDLTSLHAKTGFFSDSTLLRLALRTLIALKSLHEVGYLHRDIKPDNFAAALNGTRVVHVIDFGMVRKYAAKNGDGWALRRKRPRVAFRGTVRYCSVSTHQRLEQGRVDDMWSWLYMMVDFRLPLPWRKFDNPDKVSMVKEDVSDRKLLADPVLIELLPICDHLRKLTYFDRPDYLLITETLAKAIKSRDFNLLDDYDWEGKEDATEYRETVEKINNILKRYNSKKGRRFESRVKKCEEEGWDSILKSAEQVIVPGGEKHIEKKKPKQMPSGAEKASAENGNKTVETPRDHSREASKEVAKDPKQKESKTGKLESKEQKESKESKKKRSEPKTAKVTDNIMPTSGEPIPAVMKSSKTNSVAALPKSLYAALLKKAKR